MHTFEWVLDCHDSEIQISLDRLTNQTRVIIDGLNFFNRRYYALAYEQDYQVSAQSSVVPAGITVHPGEPREFRLTLSSTLL